LSFQFLLVKFACRPAHENIQYVIGMKVRFSQFLNAIFWRPPDSMIPSDTAPVTLDPTQDLLSPQLHEHWIEHLALMALPLHPEWRRYCYARLGLHCKDRESPPIQSTESWIRAHTLLDKYKPHPPILSLVLAEYIQSFSNLSTFLRQSGSYHESMTNLSSASPIFNNVPGDYSKRMRFQPDPGIPDQHSGSATCG